MPYAPSPEARSIAGASVRSGAIGAAIITGYVLIILLRGLGMDLLSTPVENLPEAAIVAVSAFLALIALFLLVFAAGTIAVGLCLLLFGAAIARLSRGFIQSWEGLLITIGSALALSYCIGWIFSGMPWPTSFNDTLVKGGWLFILPFAVPAAILYRREILMEQATEDLP